MRILIDRVFLLVITAAIAVLAATAAPALVEQPFEGEVLMLHMAASGVLVVALPLFALFFLGRGISRFKSGAIQRFGFWSLILTGLITIASMFVCMLPMATTHQMEQLLQLHGYAGFAMVPALLVLLLGALRWRRIQSTRSATPG